MRKTERRKNHMIIVYAAILCAAAAVLAGTIVLAKRLCLKDAITRKTREAEPDDYAQEDYYEGAPRA